VRYVFYAFVAVGGIWVWLHNTPHGRDVLRHMDRPAAGAPSVYN